MNHALAIVERELDAITREWLAKHGDDQEDRGGYPPYHYMLVRERLRDALKAEAK